jgi:hypothetical protein
MIAVCAAGLLCHLARPAPAAGQQQPASVQATARVVAVGFTVTPEVVTAVTGGLRASCAVSSEPCGSQSPVDSGTVVLHTELATVRAHNDCLGVLQPACRAVVTVQFLRN